MRAQGWIIDRHGPSISKRSRAGAPSRGSVRSHVERTSAVVARKPARDHPLVRSGSQHEISQDQSQYGSSGLNIAGRECLMRPMADVEDSEEKRKHERSRRTLRRS